MKLRNAQASAIVESSSSSVPYFGDGRHSSLDLFTIFEVFKHVLLVQASLVEAFVTHWADAKVALVHGRFTGIPLSLVLRRDAYLVIAKITSQKRIALDVQANSMHEKNYPNA